MEYVNSGFSVILFSSLWLLVWSLSCYGIGSAIIRFSFKGTDFYHTPLFYIFSVAAGLFLLSLYVFLIGILGFLQLYSLLPFLAIGILWFAYEKRGTLCRHEKAERGEALCSYSKHASNSPAWNLRSRSSSLFWPSAKNRARSLCAKVFHNDTKPLLFIVFPIFILLLVSFIAALAPETGNDALNYHLYFPKLYVEHSKIFFEPTHPRSLWPFMMEMLFTAGFLCQGAALAKLFHWLTAVLAIFAVPSSAIYFWRNKNIAWLSLIFIATIPAIWMQSLYAYVDNAMMLYTFLSFVALWMWKEKGMSMKGALVPAIFLSALVSIKFYSLIPFALLVILFIVRALWFSVWGDIFPARAGSVADAPSGKYLPTLSTSCFVRGMTILSLLCFLFCGFWFIRSWYYWGNPVFPFLPDLFGVGFHARAVGFSEMPKTFLNFLLLPWNLSMKVKTFGGEPIGILFLVSFPLLLISYKRIKGILFWIAVFCFFYLSIWFLLIQHTRFLFPLFPFLSLLFGVVMGHPESEATRGVARGISRVTLGVIIFTQFFISLYYPAKNLRAGIGLIPADRYLASTERSYTFLKEIKPLLHPDDKILFLSEPRLFYTPVEAVFYGPAIELILKKEGLSFSKWIEREKITHLLVKNKQMEKLEPEFHLRFGHQLALSYDQVIYRKIEVDHEIFYYALWKLKRRIKDDL